MKILLADDEQQLIYPIAKYLELHGFSVDTANDGQQALELATSNIYDCLVLDIMMPYLDGIALVGKLRAMHNFTPIILLTAKNSSPDRIEGFSGGADDYISKPVPLAELLSRVQALIRRNNQYGTDILTIGNLSYNQRTFELAASGISVRLSSAEGIILQNLIIHHGKIVAADYLLEKFSQLAENIDHETLDLYLKFLQKKLIAIKCDQFINISDTGFKLVQEVQNEA